MTSTLPGPLEIFLGPLRHLRWILIIAFGTALASGIASLIVTPRWTASASFIADEAQGTRLPSGLAGLAGQFGLPLNGGGTGSAQFYADLVQSRSVRRSMLKARVPYRNKFVPLIDLLDVDDVDEPRRSELAAEELHQRMGVGLDRTTRRVDLTIWMQDPRTAAAALDTLLGIVNRFDREIRRTRASERREFAEQQRRSAADSLRSAEDALAYFLERNRSAALSPALGAQRDRLQRAITLQQDVYLALAREVQEARVNEVDTRPVLTIIDPPVVPAIRTWPRRKNMVIVNTAMAVVLTWAVLLVAELLRVARMYPDSELGRAWSTTVAGARSLRPTGG